MRDTFHGARVWTEPDGPDDDQYVGPRDLTTWSTRPGRLLVTAGNRLWKEAHRVFGWAAPRWVLVLGVAIGLVVAALAATGAGEVYESVVEGDGIAGLDRPLLDAAVDARSPALTSAVQAYTDIGGPVGMPVLAITVAVLLSWRWRSWTPVALMAVTAGGSLLMTVAGKAVVGRSRPPLTQAVPPYESSFSFPSGHSLNALAMAGIVAYLLVRKLRTRWTRVLTVVLAVVFAVTMGLTRVYLGHHWLTDVMVAWTLAAGWLALVVTGHRLWLTLRRRGAMAGTGSQQTAAP